MLGEGAMGSVYLGEHLRIGRRSAIKVLRSTLAKDPEAIARFTRGVTTASKVNHPNLCSIYDFGETDDGRLFLVMELIRGESLQELLAREEALPLVDCINIVRQVAGALQAAHDIGVVHRDLKPGNIMLTTDRDGGRVVKVVDFDIAKGSTEGEPSDLTQMGLVIGTPEYMSPEQMTADRLDGRSDVYSLGMVLFRMLAGVLPFSARTTREVMLQRLTAKPGTLAAAAPDEAFPEGLQDVLDRALARDPEDRFPNAEALARALDPFDPEHRGAAQPPSVGSAGRVTSPPAAAGEVSLGPSVAPPAGAAVQPAQRGRQPEPVAPQSTPATQVTKSRPRVPARVLAPVVLIIASIGVIWAMTQGGPVVSMELALTPANATITRGEAVQMVIADGPADSGPVSWRSSDLAVASVSSTGLVTGIAPGTASITATALDRSAVAQISVTSGTPVVDSDPSEPGPPARLALDATALSLESTEAGASPSARSVSIEGANVTALQSRVRYGAGQRTGWLDARLSGTGLPATLTIGVDPGGLPVGEHRATVTVSSAEGPESTLSVTYVKRAAAVERDPEEGSETQPGVPPWTVSYTFDVLYRINDRVSDGAEGVALTAARDTAMMVWEVEGGRPQVAAAAAFALAQVELAYGNSGAALEWAERAVDRAPDNDGYRRLRDALRGARR
jgi:serine/threonine-protein kinase